MIGILVCVDRAKSQQIIISYVRLLIEVYLTKPLVEEVIVQRVNGKMFKQRVTLEWKPLFNFSCYQLEHCYENKKTRMIQKWVPKVLKTPKVPASGDKFDEVTPPIDHHIVSSESEVGWITTTKI